MLRLSVDVDLIIFRCSTIQNLVAIDAAMGRIACK